MAQAPRISINGHVLGPAQALTVQAALSSMLTELVERPDALGKDNHAQVMRAAYLEHLRTLLCMCGVEG
jgi:hypothetical protein